MVAHGRWNHNIEYHRLIHEAVGDRTGRILDVGCGEGLLSRELAWPGRTLVGIDIHEPSIAAAKTTRMAGVEFIHGDFFTHPFDAGTFQAVVSVGALHHMDTAEALVRMRDLLVPGGVLAVVGIAQAREATDWVIAGTGNLISPLVARGRPRWEHPSAVVLPAELSFRQTKEIALRLMPDARFRRRLLGRYSLVWERT
jgi:2-polyprenyl-3-methyl-5-hydroxy-6-metoxy-1,4-benzoquinol methylase